ncbi:MAG TPA: hypothetical protein VKZ52_09795, partial [Burkholderiaceae bacterium]|nr:hypothetical protein [Burkholderiaceae bacterium]
MTNLTASRRPSAARSALLRCSRAPQWSAVHRFGSRARHIFCSRFGRKRPCPVRIRFLEVAVFSLDLPWWEFVVRGAAVYVVLLVAVRISGKRTIGQFTPFDLLVVVLLSEAVGGSMSGGDESLVGGLIVAFTLLALNILISYTASRSVKLENILEGEEVLLGRNGRLFEKVLKHHRIGKNEI